MTTTVAHTRTSSRRDNMPKRGSAPSAALTKRLNAHGRILRALSGLDEASRKAYISEVKKDVIDTIVAVVRNLLKSTTRLTDTQLTRLRAKAKDIKDLLAPRASTETKRRVLQRGGFLGSLLGLIPTVIGGIANAFSGGRR